MKKQYKFKTIQEYIDLLTKANEAYYISGKNILSDPEYDLIRDEFELRFPKHKFNKTVGAPVEKMSTLPKVKHTIPMGSQSKVNTYEEFLDWYEKTCKKLNVKSVELCWSEKLDGFSLATIYQEQKLTQAVTRGDGLTGEDVTANAFKIKYIPTTINQNASGSIRGESIIRKDIFNEHFPDKANPRNAASGVVRRDDGVRCEYVDFLAYDLDINKSFITEEEKLQYIVTLGFKTPKFGVAKSSEDIKEIWQKYEDNLRSQSPYEMDGLVVSVNKIEYQNILGVIDQRPRYSRAFKFSSQRGQTKVVAINWNTGRSGRITPVATLEPIELAGVTITHATLHNLSELRKLNVTPGSTVELKRAGDVIPKIESVLEVGPGKLIIPKKCPACEEAATEQDKFLMCLNPNCSAKHYENLLYWVKTLEIKGFGEELVSQLNQANLLSTVSDFYKLTVEDISCLDRRGEKSATKVLKELHSKTEISFPTFIKALGIINFSDKTAELLQPTYSTIEELRQATKDDLLKIHGVGEIVAAAIVAGLKERKKVINELLKHITIKEYQKPKNGKLTGINFCFTGIRDKNLEQEIFSLGGKISSGVSKELNYLVARDPEENSSKLKKARELGVKVLTVSQVQALIKK